ncbi:MAG: D-glycero-beta-D-manno-heptose 1-phosphate adenylyltransferase [Ignavibacteria bacterium]|nr:D-glycero-beta-D-manno-heptose 1-phosphate adenylyltransferase [Ignavibacteria bacterium]
MIYLLNDFLKLRKTLKSKNLKLVFTNGCFDIIHRGHIEYLNRAKKLGDFLVVGLNSDKSVKLIKGSDRPVNNENDRAFVLDNIKPVDAVVIFNEKTPFIIIKKILPDLLVKGGDWKEQNIVGADVVTKNGGKVLSLPFINGYSTTEIIKKGKK